MVPVTGLDLHFLPLAENRGSNQFLNWLQQVSTGRLHLDGFDSQSRHEKMGYPDGVSHFMAYTTHFDTMQR